jgi:hypothetical protein
MPNLNPEPNIDPIEEGEFVSAPTPTATENSVSVEVPTQSQVKTPEPATVTKPFAPSFNNIDIYKLAEVPKPSEGSLIVQENDDDDNDDDDDEIGVEESRTKLPIYKSSGFKIAIIAGVLFASIATLSRIIFPGEELQKAAVLPPPSTDKKTGDFAPDPRMGVLTSKVAIQDQKNAIVAAQQQQEQQAAANKKTVGTPGTQSGTAQPTTVAPAPAPVTPALASAPPLAPPLPPEIITNNTPASTPVYRSPNRKIIYRRYKTPQPQPIDDGQNRVARSQPIPQPQPKIITRSQQPASQPQPRIITRSQQPVPQPQPRIITRSQPASQSQPKIITRSQQPTPQPQTRIITRSQQPTPQPQTRIITRNQQPAPQPQTRIITRNQQPAPMPQSSPPPSTSWETANNNAVGTWGRSNRISLALQQGGNSSAITNAVQQSQQGNSNVVPSEQINNNSVALVGQQLRGKTIVPYQVADNNKGYQTIVIALRDPLTDTNGNIMLPAGAQVMTDITILDNGLMQIASAKIIRNGQTIDLPKQSVILQNNNKQPLIAQSQDLGSGDIANRDLTTIGAGALQGVGKNLIQTQTQTIVANGATIQSTNGQVNYVGAALDGGLTPVLNQWATRNQAAAIQSTSKSKLWILPTGTDVNLIIAQPFSL